MNRPLLRAEMAKNNDTQKSLAEYLGLPVSALNNRINGKIEFRLSEISRIRRRYSLSAQNTVAIFFEEPVS